LTKRIAPTQSSASSPSRRPEAKPIALTYSRVSNPNDRREASLESQEEAQVVLLESRGFQVPPELRFRERFTGMESIYDRPVLGHVRELIANGRVGAMAAYDTDRLARDPGQLLTVVADNQKRDVETIFVKCDHATEGRIGEMLLYVKGFASALEWDAILDRTTRGRQKILQKGQWIGGGTVKYGYLWNKEERSRRANPDTAPIVRRIFEEVASGVSVNALAETLTREGRPTPFAYAGRAAKGTVWWPTVVRKIVTDRVYLGEVRARRFVATGEKQSNGRPKMKLRPEDEHLRLEDGRTEALVSRELFDRANRMMESGNTRRGRPATNKLHLLTGVIYCGRCGTRMTPVSQMNSHGKGTARYRVRSYRCFARRLKDGPRCKQVCGAKWVEEEAWNQIEEQVLKPGFLEREAVRLAKDDGADRLRADLKAAEDRRRKIDRQVKQLLECQIENADSKLLTTALKDKLRTLDSQAEDLDRHIEDLRGRIDASGQRGRLLMAFMAGIERVRDRARRGLLGNAEKRDIIEMLAARVYARTEGPDRKVTVQLPWGTCCGNFGSTMGCST
jgi:DNA invertase Pin-like site-specific DNA recombinase